MVWANPSRYSPLAELEVRYRQRKAELLAKVDLKEYVDHPFLFASRQSITAGLSRIKLYEKILGVQGSIVECGVHKGGSLMLYYHLSSIFEPYALNRQIYGFDTFEGFPSISENDPDSVNRAMFSDADCEILQELINLSDLNRPLPNVPKCQLIKGDATDTIPRFKKEHPELIIALLYLDFDLYEPTKVAIENFLPLVPKGGIVVFDELNSQKWVGETVAFKESINLNEIRLKKFPFDGWPSYFIVGE